MLLLCYAVGRTTENKKAGTSRVVFLIDLNFCKEGKKGRVNNREHLKTQTQQARRHSQVFGKTVQRRFKDISVIDYHTCNSNSHTTAAKQFFKPSQNMRSRNSGRNKGSQFLENDSTSDEIYSNDFLNVFTWEGTCEILHLQL